MVEAVQQQAISNTGVNDFNEEPMSEEQTGFLPDDGLPPMVVGLTYRLLFHDLGDSPKTGVVFKYNGCNSDGRLELVGRGGELDTLRVPPDWLARQIERGIFSIVPTTKTGKKLQRLR